MDIKHPKLIALHLRSRVEEVEAAMKAAGAPSYQYAKDKEFELFVLKDILTYKQAKAFIDMLNADYNVIYPYGECQKTWGLLQELRGRQREKEPILPIAWYLSYHRRTHCSCHEVGSFALSSRYYRAVEENEHTRKKR